MSGTKEKGTKTGFVVVHPEKGVFLGRGLKKGKRETPVHSWSYSTADAKKAPIFAEDDQDVLKEFGEGAEYKEVQIDGSGFINRADLEGAGVTWENPTPQPETTSRRRKRRSD